jgi:hypothetical protein
VLFAIAVLTLPAYMTGVAAFQKLRDQPGISEATIRLHQDVALFGFTWMEFAGFVGWVALWQARRRGRAATGMVAVATALTIVAVVVMAQAANLGGDIRHPEIRADRSAAATAAAVDPEQFTASKISYVMVNSSWAWPASETVHFLGLSLTFGVLLAVNLRILGVMKQIPFGDVHRLLPWGMLGFGANLITGMLFFVGQPKQYLDSAPFYWKVVFLMIAGANFLGREPRRQGNGHRVPVLVARRALWGPDASLHRPRLLTLRNRGVQCLCRRRGFARDCRRDRLRARSQRLIPDD